MVALVLYFLKVVMHHRFSSGLLQQPMALMTIFVVEVLIMVDWVELFEWIVRPFQEEQVVEVEWNEWVLAIFMLKAAMYFGYHLKRHLLNHT